MKYESDIAKMIHEKAMTEFQLGLLSEEDMRKYDEMCLANPKTKNKSSSDYTDNNSANAEHIRHATA